MTKRIPRCWQDGPRDDDEGTTCFLPQGHTGPHKWTRDEDVPARYRDHPAATWNADRTAS